MMSIILLHTDWIIASDIPPTRGGDMIVF